MVDVFARRLNLATRAVGMTDVLSPSQVRTFAECEVRWFYEHLLGISDPPSSSVAVEKADPHRAHEKFPAQARNKRGYRGRRCGGTVPPGMEKATNLGHLR